jgi:hypothetical protein
MKTWMKVTGCVVLGLVVVVVGGGFLISPKWEVVRSRVIPAKPAEIHAYVGDFAKWPVWSPFEKEDPEMVITVGEKTTGVGAKRSWKSDKAGNGTQTITASDPETGASFLLEMEGWEGFHADIVYQPVKDGTRVTWCDRGDMGANPIFRWMGLFMDGMVGKAFEEGLANLETAVAKKM